MKHEQLNWVFAEAPQESGDKEMPDLWASPSSRLHKTQVKEFERFVTGATDASSLLEATASEFNLWVSLNKVVQNKGAPGVDGVSVETVLAQIKELLPRLRRQRLEGSYRPGDIRRVWIPKPGGGERGLGSSPEINLSVWPTLFLGQRWDRLRRWTAERRRVGEPARSRPAAPGRDFPRRFRAAISSGRQAMRRFGGAVAQGGMGAAGVV
jgi:hypothetical protein